MAKRIMKTKLIKKYFGDVIKEEGFEYVGADSVAWKFTRQKGKVNQEIYIVRDRFFPNLITLCLCTGMPGWGMQEPRDFMEKYKNREYWRYETEEEFAEIIQEFARIIKEQGLDMLEKMSEPKDTIYATPEMNQYLYESYETIVAEANQKYDFEKSGEEGIKNITSLLYANKNREFDEVKDFLVEMAALYLEIFKNDMGGEMVFQKETCVLIGTGTMHWDNLLPLPDIVGGWKAYHQDETEFDFLLTRYQQLKKAY